MCPHVAVCPVQNRVDSQERWPAFAGRAEEILQGARIWYTENGTVFENIGFMGAIVSDTEESVPHPYIMHTMPGSGAQVMGRCEDLIDA